MSFSLVSAMKDELNRFALKRPGTFVIRLTLQSTLRDLHALLASPRLAATFCVVVLLFVVTGPFGTLTRMNFAERLGYWLAIQAGSWLIALTLSALADGLLANRISHRLPRFIVGSLLAAPLIGFYLTMLDSLLFGWPFRQAVFGKMTLEAVPLCLLFCVLSYLTMERAAAAVPSDTGARAGPIEDLPATPDNRTAPILLRLKPEHRARLRHLSVEDHYTVVTTTRGRELLLLRFADAIAETSPVEGLQVHRSHWVATTAVSGLVRRGGKRMVRLDDGEEIPISRPYLAAARAAFSDLPAAPGDM